MPEPVRTKVFIDQQNRVRGIFAERRQTGFVGTAPARPLLNFRTGMRRAMLAARAALHISEYADFLEWYDRQHAVEFPNGRESDIAFDYLNGIIVGPPLPLPKEFMWLFARLVQHRELIGTFRSAANRLDALCVDGDYMGALRLLDEIATEFGESMWSVQLRIALKHKAEGLESQKAYYEEVRQKYSRGILAYVAHQTSVLNEDRTTWQRFSETVIQSSAKRKDKEVGDYLKYRLINIWPDSPLAIANVLRVEQSHSIVDQYETFVSYCQTAVTKWPESDLTRSAKAAAAALKMVQDFRLDRIEYFAGDASTKRFSMVQNCDQVGPLVASALEKPRNSNPWLLILDAYSLLPERDEPDAIAPSLITDIVARFIHSRGNVSSAAAELEKLALVFRGLPTVRGVHAYLQALYPSADISPFQFWQVDLNSSTATLANSYIAQILRGAANPHSTEPSCRLANAFAHFSACEYDAAIEELNEHRRSSGDPVDWLADLLHLWLAYELHNQNAVIATISRLGSRDPSSIAVLPIKRLIGSLPVGQFKSSPEPLAPLNALNMLWRDTEWDRVASNLRLMTGQFLRRPRVGAPSTMIEDQDRYDRDELIYFLREVCVPSVLDVSRVFPSSQAVQEERQAIFAALNVLDPPNSAYYSDEVLAIARRLKVDEGLRIVDQSRVHVDTEAVTRWAHRTLQEDFDRYNDLARAGIGATGNFDDALREVKDAIRHSKQGEFFTPQNEADNALVRLLRAIREEFLNSSAYGLDYFLSKRIRHVSFIGLVRGPLEFAHLISTKPTASSAYGSNPFWLERLSTLNADQRATHISQMRMGKSGNFGSIV